MKKRNITILIIDDEPNICTSLEGILEDEGYVVYTAHSGEEGLDKLTRREANLVLLDILMPGGMDGIETLRKIKEDYPDVGVIMITGYGTFQYALEAGKLGALDFIEKPLSLEKVLTRIELALEKMRLEAENIQLKWEVAQKYKLVGKSRPMQKIFEKIARVAPTNGRVLIRGESGTGKELVARAIHNQSLRGNKLFVPVNCAALPQELIESELFGYERGAFTGATNRRIGKFEQADGGTLFLDEIGNMTLQTQAKVLRAVETQEFERLGGKNTIKVDVRVIAATNKDLTAEIREGNFREDLYYRLNVVPIDIPPLRQRKEDIPLLAEYFLDQFCRENNKPKKRLSPEAMKVLERYSWPGNVRELRNIIERLVIMSRSDLIETEDLPIELEESASDKTQGGIQEAKREFERNFILQCLENNNWNITESARQLGIERTNLHRKMRQYGIHRKERT